MTDNIFNVPREIFHGLVARTGAEVVEAEFSFESHEVRGGTDDFCITGVDGKLLFAGGNIRGVIYAVYEYFERFCGCRWFWDGDIVPSMKTLPVEGIHYRKQFRRKYRGLRYFAHRSLYRFQAEHWTLDTWKQEIDYLMKRHFSFFMLRTGQDDLFQKAFPDVVPYPPLDGPAPEAKERSYNDRTELISLEYRGKLRKELLDYAFERGLMHPEDMGPMTHWYSHTPKAFLEHFKPEFMNQSSDNYANMELQVWDCSKPANIEKYFELTDAHIRNYGKPDVFHTIGLAERVFGDPEKNFDTKTAAFRAFDRRLRRDYPNSPLFVASWDFMFRWNAPEVRRFLSELDPDNTIILDYTTDSGCPYNNFLNWGLPGGFPWIFGIFQAYEPQCDLFFDFKRIEDMYRFAKDDNFCKGMVIWSENSHSNPLLLEYLAKRSADEPFSLEQFCRDRYEVEYADRMLELWKLTEGPFATNSWVFGTERPYQGIYTSHFNLLGSFRAIAKRNPAHLYSECSRKHGPLMVPTEFFEKAAELAECECSEMMRRDLVDLIRSALMCLITREICDINMKLTMRNPEKADASRLLAMIAKMADLLETMPEYSMNSTLDTLRKEGPLNPHAEMTLKGNAENSYCRSYIHELYRAVYIPEAEALREHLDALPAGSYPDAAALEEKEKSIRDRFYSTSLEEWRPREGRTLAGAAAEIAAFLR